ncbi:MAG: aldolase [Proteobacteria bacterium]|nr:aldolase [Pseudomonadota bacterium]
MRKPNTLKKRLKQGEAVFGPWCVLPSSAVANITAAAGMDFIIIDMEHGPASFETAEDMVRAMESEGCCPLVRVGDRTESTILRALDIGAHGVIAPHVESGADAQDVVSFVKYWPLGTRGFSPYTRAGGYGGGDITAHADRENQETLTAVILEGKAGLANLEAILSVSELDLVYIGAYDLSQAMGMPGQVGRPEIKSEMERCIRIIRDAGVAAGGYVAKNRDDMRWMLDIGMQFITYLPDVTVIFKAFEDGVKQFRDALEKR